MTEYLITKLSDSDWHDFESFETIEEAMKFFNEMIIIRKNYTIEYPTSIPYMLKHGYTYDEAMRAFQCEYEIVIYDDYFE